MIEKITFPENDRGHEYLPSWDYDPLDVDTVYQPHVDMIKEIGNRILERVIPSLEFRGFEVFLTGRGLCGNGIAIYIEGTTYFPVVGIDLDAHAAEGGAFYDAVEESINHELAHGFQESCGVVDFDQQCEDNAEQFARDFTAYGDVETETIIEGLYI